MIGTLRTDALREAVLDAPADDAVLLGLLVLAFAGDNVSVQAPGADGRHGRRRGRTMSGTDARDDGAATRRQEAANRRIDAALEALGDLAGGYRLAPGDSEAGDADLAEDVAGALEAGSAQLRASLARRHAAAGAALMRRLLGPGDGPGPAGAPDDRRKTP